MLPEVGIPEMLLIAAIALIVVGPKDLPVLMRKVGKFLAHMRGMAAEFRSSFDEMARQSELDELRKEVEAMRAAARQPAHAAMQSMGLHDINSEITADLAYNPHETYQPHVGPLGEQLEEHPVEALPAPPVAEAAPEEEPKPKPRRRSKPKAKPEADAAETPTPESPT
jgi:sec-independent protein translocase protein TatB